MNYKTIKLPGFKKLSCINLKEALTIYKDIFIFKEYKLDLTTKYPLILDCGAHIGLSVLYFKKNYPQSRIIAFEPNPVNFKLLDLNVKQNKLHDIKLINAAVWEKEGEVDFYVSKEGDSPWTWGDSLVKNKWYVPRESITIKVQAVRLSSFITRKVDFIKMDIEGAETKVVQEIEEKLNLIKRITMEFHGSSTNRQNSIEKIIKVLRRNGFDCIIKQGDKITSLETIKRTDPYWLIIHAGRK